jgi:hypothetical protein
MSEKILLIREKEVRTEGRPGQNFNGYWNSARPQLRGLYSVRSARLCSSVPLLEPGTPRFSGGMQKRINHTRVATNTRPTKCPTQPRRMIDASRGYTFIFNN